MRLFLLAVGILSLSVQTLAAPNNTQLNEKIKTLKDRVSILEDAVADLKKSSTVYVFAGFTEEIRYKTNKRDVESRISPGILYFSNFPGNIS